jgi:cell fate (sporulation/competence/biofilm development) regulator YlbF (YheA/YmcA/DUF963 family)
MKVLDKAVYDKLLREFVELRAQLVKATERNKSWADEVMRAREVAFEIEKALGAALLPEHLHVEGRERIGYILTDVRRLVTDALSRLAAANKRIKGLESLRPVWAHGNSEASVAMQVAAAALASIWEKLNVSNQTDAIIKIDNLIAANKRIEEAEKQEPVGFFNPKQVFTCDDFGVVCNRPNEREGQTIPLYTRPIPPADVAELQRKIEVMRDTTLGHLKELDTRGSLLADYMRKECAAQQRIAELERIIQMYVDADKSIQSQLSEYRRKLAEQQAVIETQIECVGITAPNMASKMRQLAEACGSKELSKLLSEARNEEHAKGREAQRESDARICETFASGVNVLVNYVAKRCAAEVRANTGELK